ncbi:MAG: triose-phosphate isomerase [Lachnospiraceae bacterium]|nr:triose-phosphate isomerase [Lachnospiraceae bacterium]
MKAKLKTPFFEIGVKNYIYGDEVLQLAKAADQAAVRYDIDVIFLAPYVDIRRIAENTQRILVFAPYMDILRPGRGMADVLPEAVRAAGAQGVVVNHCERPMTLGTIRETLRRADELDMLSFACADTIAEARAIAQLGPDIINPEPSELIGTDCGSSDDFIRESIRVVKEADPRILVEQAAGIRSGEQVYHNIILGADGVGAASGIVNAKDPLAMVDEMVGSVRRACEELRKGVQQL